MKRHTKSDGTEPRGAFTEINARQVVLGSDFLGAKVLLDCDGVVGAAKDSGVVGDDHDGMSVDTPNSRDDSACRHVHRLASVAVQVVAGQLRQFEEGRAGIQQRLDSIAREQFAARLVQRTRLLRAP